MGRGSVGGASTSTLPVLRTRWTRKHVDGHDVAYIDPRNEEVWPVIESIYQQLIEITGSPYFHIGCDEAFRMPDDLYAEFVKRAMGVARGLGSTPATSQEATRAGLTPGDITQIWIDFAGPDGDLARMEADVAAGRPLPDGFPASALKFYRTAGEDLQ